MSHHEVSTNSDSDTRQMQNAVKDEAAWLQSKKWHAELTGGYAAEFFDQPDMRQALHREFLQEKAVNKQSTSSDQAHESLKVQADQGFLNITPIFHKNS